MKRTLTIAIPTTLGVSLVTVASVAVILIVAIEKAISDKSALQHILNHISNDDILLIKGVFYLSYLFIYFACFFLFMKSAKENKKNNLVFSFSSTLAILSAILFISSAIYPSVKYPELTIFLVFLSTIITTDALIRKESILGTILTLFISLYLLTIDSIKKNEIYIFVSITLAILFILSLTLIIGVIAYLSIYHSLFAFVLSLFIIFIAIR